MLSIDAHGLKIQGGGGVLEVFAKIPRGGLGFQEICRGVHLFCVLLQLFRTPLPPYPPLCASMMFRKRCTDKIIVY
jgi:hypothetical protein